MKGFNKQVKMFQRLNYLEKVHSVPTQSPAKTSINQQASIDYNNRSMFDNNMSQYSTSVVSTTL